MVTDTLRNKKSPGLENIPAILWKDELFHPYLMNLCNHVFTTLECPSSWRVSGIVPVPKKGNLSDPFYYRGISLRSIASKIYNKLILNRLAPTLDPILRRNQNAGYEKGLLIHPRRSRRHPSVHVTDLDFADDLAITSDTVQNAEELLHVVEEAAVHVGLHCKPRQNSYPPVMMRL